MSRVCVLRHGGQTVDVGKDEDDGSDETIIPVDFRKVGQIPCVVAFCHLMFSDLE